MLRLRKPSPAMVVACIALAIALSGASYAAIKIPRNSVGTPQLKKNAVTSPKVRDASLRAQDFAPGQLPQGPKGDTGERGPQGPGAARINYIAGASALVDIATVGPWTIAADCYGEAGDYSQVTMYVKGPGRFERAGMTTRPGVATTPQTGGDLLNPAQYVNVLSDYTSGGVLRLAYDLQLQFGQATATVSVHGLADMPNGTCTLLGTAVPGS